MSKKAATTSGTSAPTDRDKLIRHIVELARQPQPDIYSVIVTLKDGTQYEGFVGRRTDGEFEGPIKTTKEELVTYYQEQATLQAEQYALQLAEMSATELVQELAEHLPLIV